MKNNKANIKKIILEDGTIFHFQNHVLHRNNGPAVIYPDGTKEWWINGRRHRSELFAIITSFGKDIKIRNGKVIMKYWDDINDDLIIETYDEKHVEYIERTYKILSSIPLRILQLPHSETIDTTEKDTIKIYSFGIAHSVVGPSEIKTNGTRVYYKFGVKHCEHSPAIIDSVTNSEYWYRYGMLHREDGPAITKTDESSITYSYFKHGVSERIDGPAEIVYKTKFKKNVVEIWMKQGRLHRTLDFNNSEGPAMKITQICPDSEKIGEIYFAHFREGELYNLNGPASYCIDNGRKRFEDYFINEEKVEKEKFIKIMRHVKLFTKKIMTPKRKKLSNCLYKHLTFFCKDLCNEISEFVL